MLRIERTLFADPWSDADFRAALREPGLFLVADLGEGVVAYVVARCAADEGEILNLGVASEHQRHGVGRALAERALAALSERGARSVYLEVRESNAAGLRLYARLGFSEIGRRRRYYRRPVEDAIVLRRAAILAAGPDA